MTCGNAKEVAFVVGGGIGGLAAALALHEAGYSVKVFEQAPALSEIGAGINVLPVGVKVLTSLGLLEKLIGTGPTDGAAIQTSDLVYCAPSGAIVLKEKRGKSAGHSSPQLSVHRGWLHRAMFEAAKERIGEENIFCGHVFSTYTQDDEKVTCVFKVSASPEEKWPNQFTATKSYDAAFMIGADGVKSGVRAVKSEDKPVYTGWRIYRGVLEIDSQMYDGRTMLTYGTGKCASVLYPVSEKKRQEGKTLLNWGINCHESILAKELQGVGGEEAWTRRGPKSEFKHLVDGWVFPKGCFPDSTIDFTKLINDTADNNVTCYALHDRDPIHQWTHGRVTLLGDSAHPLLPFGSTGAGQALLDVEALQLEIKAMPAGGNCRALLKTYDKARVEKAGKVVIANREMGPTKVLKMFEDAVGTKPLPEQEKWVQENTQEIVDFSNSFQKLSGLCRKDEVQSSLEENCAKKAKLERNLKPWLGLWQWSTPNSVRAFEYYKFWGTLTDAEAQECATSHKEFGHESISEKHLEIMFKAQDTTRNADIGYTIQIDGQPHEIDPVLRARANNSIKMNPTGRWAHWWDGNNLVMEQPCVVRETAMIHRVTRVLSGDVLLCHELVTVKETGEELVHATMGFARAKATG